MQGGRAVKSKAASGSFKTVKTSSPGRRKDCSSTSKRSHPLNPNHASAGIFLGKFSSPAPANSMFAAKVARSSESAGNHHGWIIGARSNQHHLVLSQQA